MTAVLCVGLFLASASSQRHGPAPWFEHWGWEPASAIWGGRYWALLTSSVLHFEPLHLVFNVYWLWVLGSALEERIGAARWALFWVLAAFVSSMAQIAATDDAGVGASGVIYAIFGLAWAGRSRVPEFARVAPDRTVQLMLGWFVLCVLLTLAKVWIVGNGAHAGGLVFGLAVGHACYGRDRTRAAAVGAGALLVASAAALVWCPWSAAWATDRAVRAYERKDFDESAQFCRRVLALTSDPKLEIWAWDMLARSQVAAGRQEEFRETLEQLRKLDPSAAAKLDVYRRR